MNYSKNKIDYQKGVRRNEIAKRIITSWCVVGVVCLLLGSLVGYALKSHITRKDKQKNEEVTTAQIDDVFTVYGAFDNRIFTEEVSLDWGSGDLDFTPLKCDMPKEHQEFLYYLCAGYNLDFPLVMGLIQQESSFDSDVISRTNDYGYMQINKINHSWLTDTIGTTNYTDPYENMRAGCFILRKLFEQYQDTDLVLMCYNLGETGASRLWDKGIYSTTYTEKVIQYQERFYKQMEK